MNRLEILTQIRQEGVVAILRLDRAAGVLAAVDALQQGGVHAIEITMGTPGVLRLIEQVAAEYPQVLIGAGSVLDAATARAVISAGARFIVTPISRKKVIQAAHRYDVPIFSGAFSPGEVLTAFEQGADVVKLFPAEVLGVAFLKAIKAPMPQLQLMPTGGVTVENAGDWIRAGACALGIGSALVDPHLLAAGNYAALTQRARALRDHIDLARPTTSR